MNYSFTDAKLQLVEERPADEPIIDFDGDKLLVQSLCVVAEKEIKSYKVFQYFHFASLLVSRFKNIEVTVDSPIDNINNRYRQIFSITTVVLL